MMNTSIVGKIFKSTLPDRPDRKNYCNLLKDDDKFVENVLKIKGVRSVSELDATGSYIIETDMFLELTDDELISKINEIANSIGFMMEE